jgi:Holliday junction resolvase RusA-like endonuclease
VITLRKPTSLNSLYGYNRYGSVYMTDEGKTWKQEATYTLRSQCKLRTDGDISLYLKYYVCGLSDIDAPLKILLDSIEASGIIKNDKQITFLQIEKVKVTTRKEQKIEIEIEEAV